MRKEKGGVPFEIKTPCLLGQQKGPDCKLGSTGFGIEVNCFKKFVFNESK